MIFGKKKIQKREDFDLMKSVFKDSKRRRYYQYINDTDLSLKRFSYLKRLLMELQMVLDRDELNLFLDAMEESLSKPQIDVPMLGHLIKEMRERQEYLVHEDIMFRIIACLYIREDQNPSKIDEEEELAKAAFLKKECEGKPLRPFFLEAGMSKYLPFLKNMKGSLEKQLEMTKRKQKAIEEQIKNRTGLEAKSLVKLTELTMSE